MNQFTEQDGFDAVIAYEQARGRTVKRVQKCGYDLHSTDTVSERHIEVKATAKPHFTFRWLEQLEWNLAQNDPHFYLYLVTDAGSSNPRVFEYDREKLQKRFSRVEHHYIYNFPRADFK